MTNAATSAAAARQIRRPQAYARDAAAPQAGPADPSTGSRA
jgi:hypothetical protein